MAINLHASFLAPPFGFAPCFPHGVARVEIKTVEIYRGVMLFIAIHVLVLAPLWPIRGWSRCHQAS